MVLGYLIVGVIAGLAGFLVTLGLGASLWSAIAIYSLVGTASTLLFPLTLLALGAARAWLSSDRQPAPGDDLLRTSGRLASPEQAPAMADAAEQAMRILAVDDDPFILELIPKIAAKVGSAGITTASSGAQALAILKKTRAPFDCLLLDINMPEIDGIELCARIRRMSAYRDTPIIMLTAMTDMDYLDRAFLAGASDFTAKPFDVIDFGNRLEVAHARVAAMRAEVVGGAANAATQMVRDQGMDQGSTRLVPLAGVPALIEHAALQNYLARLSGVALAHAYVMAVAIDRTLGGGETTATGVPLQILMRVARAIDDVLSAPRCIMAYVGDGRFVVVATAASLPNATAVESAIQERLNRQAFDADWRDDHGTKISAGQAVRPGAGRQDRARIALESALRLANDRAAGKEGALRSTHLRPTRR